MKNVVISCNEDIYRHDDSFKANGWIDWRIDNATLSVGDVVYLYQTAPMKRIAFETIVIKEFAEGEAIFDDGIYYNSEEAYIHSRGGKHYRLKLLSASSKGLTLEELHQYGLKGNIQGPRYLNGPILDLIEETFSGGNDRGLYPDEVPNLEGTAEGAVEKVTVNRYERDPENRKKCIEANGCRCAICGMSFEETYGELGRGFIHVHHLVPLNEVGASHVVDPVKDLIPVCPNCHAMLHHKDANGHCPTPEELKAKIAESRSKK